MSDRDGNSTDAVPEDAAVRKVEVLVGRRVSATDGGPEFLGVKVRFRG